MSPLVVTLVIAGLAFMAVVVLAFAFFGNALGGESRSKRRLDAIASREVQKGVKPVRDREKERRKVLQETMKELEQRQREERAKMTLKRRLEQAGLTISSLTFYGVSAGFGVTAGLIAFVLHVKILIALLIAFACGAGVPRWALSFLGQRRKNAFAQEFANAIDIIVRGVKSGLPLNECLQIIARESQSPLKEEFQAAVDAQKMGVTLEQSLTRMYESMPVPEVNFFAIVLTIQQKTGGNLSEALGNLAAVLRGRKTLKGKIEAMSSEAKASAMIIGVLPPGVMLMVYLSTPAYISLLWTEHLGQLMMIGGILWMATGIFVMRRMINFNF